MLQIQTTLYSQDQKTPSQQDFISTKRFCKGKGKILSKTYFWQFSIYEISLMRGMRFKCFKKIQALCELSKCAKYSHLATFGPVWSPLAPFGPVWPCLAPFCTVWPYLAPFGPIWPCFASFHPVLPCFTRFRPVLHRFAPFCPVSLCFTSFGPVWIRLDPCWPILAWFGPVWPSFEFQDLSSKYVYTFLKTSLRYFENMLIQYKSALDNV